MRKFKKRRFSSQSILRLSFSNLFTTFWVPYMGDQLLPKLDTLDLRNLDADLDTFGKFMHQNFPVEVRNLIIAGYRLNFDQFSPQEVEIISQRVKEWLHLSGFKMKISDVETILNANQHLRKISFHHSVKISGEQKALTLTGKFPNLEELNFERVNLSRENVEDIGKIFSFKFSNFQIFENY